MINISNNIVLFATSVILLWKSRLALNPNSIVYSYAIGIFSPTLGMKSNKSLSFHYAFAPLKTQNFGLKQLLEHLEAWVCCVVLCCVAGGGEVEIIRDNRIRPEANQQLVHQPEEAALETVRGYAICSYGWRCWKHWRTCVLRYWSWHRKWWYLIKFNWILLRQPHFSTCNII